MYIYDLHVFIKSVKVPSEKFNILNLVEFVSGPTRSAGYKLRHMKTSKNSVVNSYFYRIPRLRNSLPLIDLFQTLQTIKFKLKNYNFSLTILTVIICVLFFLLPLLQMFKHSSSYKLFYSLTCTLYSYPL